MQWKQANVGTNDGRAKNEEDENVFCNYGSSTLVKQISPKISGRQGLLVTTMCVFLFGIPA